MSATLILLLTTNLSALAVGGLQLVYLLLAMPAAAALAFPLMPGDPPVWRTGRRWLVVGCALASAAIVAALGMAGTPIAAAALAGGTMPVAGIALVGLNRPRR